jgi:hypothetical protein
MEIQPYCFISYSRNDKAFVDRLSNDLNENRVNTWIDTQQISPGALWQDEIKLGIERADIVIVILSNNYLNSSWTSFELAMALKKRIFPLKIEDFRHENLPKTLSNLLWIDFQENYENGLELLLKSIPKNIISNQPLQQKENISKGYVFLSFSDDDSIFVNGLRGFLKSQDFAYWDFKEGDRDYHIQFFIELESVINDSEAVLSIISPSWRSSKWTIREFIYSEEIGKPVLLLRAKETKPILAIAGLPYIDFVINSGKGFIKLEKELSKRLK